MDLLKTLFKFVVGVSFGDLLNFPSTIELIIQLFSGALSSFEYLIYRMHYLSL